MKNQWLNEKLNQKFFNDKKIIYLIVFFIIIAFLLFLGISYFKKSCKDENCFFNALDKCDKVSWIREDSQAAWSYNIMGSPGKNTCEVEVSLVKLKQGTIDIEKLEGKKMTCVVDKGSRSYPEKILSKCTGILKEEMQEIIIQKMHNYIFNNIGEIQEGFEGI